MDTQVTAMVSAFALMMGAAWAQDESVPVRIDDDSEVFVEMNSREFIGEEKLAWITDMRKKLPIASRAVGPFGLPQDPDAEAVKPQQKKMKKGAFLSAVAAIKINTVMPSDDKFTIGSREFTEDEVFPLIRHQRQFNIKVVSVRRDSILFVNVDTGEKAKKNLNSLPAGMKKNTSLVAIQGVFPANRRNAMPLNLDDEPLPVSNE